MNLGNFVPRAHAGHLMAEHMAMQKPTTGFRNLQAQLHIRAGRKGDAVTEFPLLVRNSFVAAREDVVAMEMDDVRPTAVVNNM